MRRILAVVRIPAVVIVLSVPVSALAQSLPGTQPLTADPDFSATMLRGLHALADRLTERSQEGRRPTREKLAAAIGIADPRLPVTALELVGDTASPALVMETERCRVFRVRWPVFDGVHGEGIFVQPKGKPLARLVVIPDATQPPEALVDARVLAAGCEVVIPALVSRGTRFSTADLLRIRTNIPHREWIYRQGYQPGRHLIGLEVQKTLAVIDWFKAQPEPVPVVVAGLGEGGMLALFAGALDERIDGVFFWRATSGCEKPCGRCAARWNRLLRPQLRRPISGADSRGAHRLSPQHLERQLRRVGALLREHRATDPRLHAVRGIRDLGLESGPQLQLRGDRSRFWSRCSDRRGDVLPGEPLRVGGFGPRSTRD